jgi:hypothetical protein
MAVMVIVVIMAVVAVLVVAHRKARIIAARMGCI